VKRFRRIGTRCLAVSTSVGEELARIIISKVLTCETAMGRWDAADSVAKLTTRRCERLCLLARQCAHCYIIASLVACGRHGCCLHGYKLD
jgi:hypothetical protein